jgi:hypothetical protein
MSMLLSQGFPTGRRIAFVVANAMMAVGCAASDGLPTAAPATSGSKPQEVLSLTSRALSISCAGAGETISPGPSVIVADAGGAPHPNVAVRFTVMAGGGAVDSSIATTNGAGVATAGSWRLGTTLGSNTVVASLETGATARFTVVAGRRGTVVAAYRLVTIGGRPLPQTYSGGGASWTITGGHYYLADNGTFLFGYEFAPTPVPATICSGATYSATDADMIFYLEPGSYPQSTFYQQRNGLFATGKLSGRVMTVKYEDPVDFEDETYERATALQPSRTTLLPRMRTVDRER